LSRQRRPQKPNLPAQRPTAFTEQEAAVALARADMIGKAVASVSNASWRIAAAGAVAYVGGQWAGQTTIADIDLNTALIEIGAARWVPWGLLLVAVVWAMIERRLRRRNIRRMAGRLHQLELRLDPARGTSGLSPDGTAPPGDR
jgi:hypothetical protein